MKQASLLLWLICLAAPWTSLRADPWGHLFTTPLQRAQLDSGQAAPVNTSNASNDTQQTPSIKPLQLTGTLTSSRGHHTVWLNGKPVTQGVRLLGAGRVQLRVTSAEHPRLMKSGQLLYPQTGKIVEAYAAQQPSSGKDDSGSDPDSAATSPQ